ncbi:hypothetical protein OESDEN_25063, partial [Oesophagostomum dentatum]
LFFLLTSTSVSGYVWKRKVYPKGRQEFSCEDSCYSTVVEGLGQNVGPEERRYKVKNACEYAVSSYTGVPRRFCPHLVTNILKDKRLQEDVEELFATLDSSLVDGLEARTRTFCAKNCLLYKR